MHPVHVNHVSTVLADIGGVEPGGERGSHLARGGTTSVRVSSAFVCTVHNVGCTKEMMMRGVAREKKTADRFCVAGQNIQTNEEVAIKLECIKTKHPQLHIEAKFYKLMQGGVGALGDLQGRRQQMTV